MRNEKGSITVDYLFAFILVSGFSMIILTFSATLSTVEIVQYMAFSAARNYFAANVSEAKQKEAGFRKFSEMKASPAVSPLLKGGWFHVPDESLLVDYNIPQKYSDFKDYESSPRFNFFHGVVVSLEAKILDFQIPFFGATKKEVGEEDSKVNFSTYITAFLGREPTFDECNSFNEQRWENIKQLQNSLGAAAYSVANDKNNYVVINDNGC